MNLSDMLPRLLHDIRAQLRKSARSAQLLQQSYASGGDAGTRHLAALLETQRQTDLLLTRVGLLVEGNREDTGPSLPINTIVQSTRMTCKPSLQSAYAEWHPEVLDALPVPAKLQLALEELVDNSVRFRLADRPLVIRLWSALHPPLLHIYYSDTGTGFDPVYAEKIFQPFEKLDPERGGFGLGLTIARSVMESLGGNIRATSDVNGATFTLSLPVA